MKKYAVIIETTTFRQYAIIIEAETEGKAWIEAYKQIGSKNSIINSYEVEE